MKNFIFNNLALLVFMMNGISLAELIGGEVSFIPRTCLIIFGWWCGAFYGYVNDD